MPIFKIYISETTSNQFPHSVYFVLVQTEFHSNIISRILNCNVLVKLLRVLHTYRIVGINEIKSVIAMNIE